MTLRNNVGIAGLIVGLAVLAGCDRREPPAMNAPGPAVAPSGAGGTSAAADSAADSTPPESVPSSPTARGTPPVSGQASGAASERVIPSGSAVVPPPAKPPHATDAPSSAGEGKSGDALSEAMKNMPADLKAVHQGVGAAAASVESKLLTEATEIPIGKFRVQAPAGWTVQPPGGAMRLAQFALPAVEGDTPAPELVVFFFGPGGGGGVDANIERWRGQFDDGDTPNPGTVEVIENDGGKITLLDKLGTFKQTQRMMSNEFTPQPNWRMLAAVAECDGGPLFVRVTGPDKSVAAQRESMIAMLKSLRKG